MICDRDQFMIILIQRTANFKLFFNKFTALILISDEWNTSLGSIFEYRVIGVFRIPCEVANLWSLISYARNFSARNSLSESSKNKMIVAIDYFKLYFKTVKCC